MAEKTQQKNAAHGNPWRWKQDKNFSTRRETQAGPPAFPPNSPRKSKSNTRTMARKAWLRRTAPQQVRKRRRLTMTAHPTTMEWGLTTTVACTDHMEGPKRRNITFTPSMIPMRVNSAMEALSWHRTRRLPTPACHHHPLVAMTTATTTTIKTQARTTTTTTTMPCHAGGVQEHRMQEEATETVATIAEIGLDRWIARDRFGSSLLPRPL